MLFEKPILTRARFPVLNIHAFGEKFEVFIMGEFKNEQRVVSPDAYETKVLEHSDERCVIEFVLKKDSPVNKYVSFIVSKTTHTDVLIGTSVYEYDTVQLILTKDSADIIAPCLVPWHTNLEVMSAAEMKKLFLDKHGEFVPQKDETPKE